MKTAVEYLAYVYALQGAIYQDDIDKAIEMHKEQLIDFHIEVMKKGLEYENEEEWSDEYLPLIKKVAEQYYNETFKKDEQ
jgi:hypothetical protein